MLLVNHLKKWLRTWKAMISEKQKKILAFPYSDYDAIICDGAVRSGKTSIMMVAFVDWAMRNFSGQRFGICAKTVGSAKQNIVVPYMGMSYAQKRYNIKWHGQEKILEVSRGPVRNIFELFGGKDESSFTLIQGRTLAGILLDEVVLMPQNFVHQALSRCSVDGAKYWFSCNPGAPTHWFYLNWIKRHRERNALYLHFQMRDNPSLSEKTLQMYENNFAGVFYDRYILGLWVLAEGIIYPMYKDAIEKPPDGRAERYCISIDYGTQNAFSVSLWGKYGNVWYIVDEYYYSGRETGVQKTDTEYGDDLDKFLDEHQVTGTVYTVIDPSAASFITLLRKKTRYRVKKAKNDVSDGIRDTAVALKKGLIKVSPVCKRTIEEFGGYVWDDTEAEDRPVKVNDHAMDNIRYFVATTGLAKEKTDYKAVWD